MKNNIFHRYGISVDDLDHVASHVKLSFNSHKYTRFLVTGATGFFGQWLLESFHHVNQTLGLGAKLVGVGGPNDDFASICPHILLMSDIHLIKADICNLDSEMRTLLPEWNDGIDIMIHAAIFVDSKTYASHPLPTLETGVKGTWEALEYARRTKAKRFLFISSGAVYGNQPFDLESISEDQTVNLDCADFKSAYAEGKRLGETLCCAFMRQFGLPTIIARPFSFVGPYLPLNRHFAIGNFLHDALVERPILIEGDGSSVRSYLYAADLAIWLWRILLDGAPGRPYNVGSAQPFSLIEVASLIEKVSMHSNSIEILRKVEYSLPSRYIPDITRAELELGLEVTISIDDAIRRTLDWYRIIA